MKKNIRIYLISFLLPIAIFAFSYACLGIYFGKADFLLIDLHGQYLSFFSYYQDTLWQGYNFFYSFSKGLGDGILSLFAYYLASPLNLIILLFPKEQLVDGLFLITLIKVGLCGLTFFTFIKPKTQDQKTALIFSICYALMGYVLFYSQNIMWLDGIFWLPIICLGIERLIFKRKPFVYIFALSIALISNYYIGYILCIGSVLYLLYQFIFFYQEIQNKIHVLLHFALSSFLAAMLSAFILVPAFFSVSTKMSLEVLDNKYFLFSIIDFIGKFILGWSNKTVQLINSNPNIYCGIASALLFIILMLQKKIKTREKLALCVFLLVLVLSMSFSFTHYIWHALKKPMGFNYRQSFIFSFFLLTIVASYYSKIEKLKRKQGIILIAIFVFGIIILALYPNKYSLSWISYIATLGFVFLYLCLFMTQPKRFSDFFLVLVVIELIFNTILTYNTFPFLAQKDVQKYYENNAIHVIPKNQRMVIKNTYNNNDAFLLNFAGMDHFSSVENARDYTFRKSAGYHYREHQAYYEDGSTLFMDTVLGIQRRVDATPSYFKWNNDLVKENEDAFPFLFFSNEKIKDAKIHLMNPFKFQNEIYRGVSGSKEDLFIEVLPMQRSIENVKEVTDYGLHQCTKIDTKKPAYVRFILPQDANQLYFNISTDDTNLIYEPYLLNVSINKKSWFPYIDKQFSREGSLFIEPNGGTNSTLDVEIVNDYMDINKFQFYKMDQSQYEQFVKNQNKGIIEVKLLNSNKLQAKIHSDILNQYIMTSIPYDQN